jgi:dipeptidyl aminopeptidase/acylaminoacyl peptidase
MLALRRVVVVVSFCAALCGLTGAAAASPPMSGTIVYTFERTAGAQGSWLEVTDLVGGNRRVLTPIPSLKTRRFDRLAKLSPDGTKVAFIRMGRRSGNVLYVVNTDGSDLHVAAGPDQVGQGIDDVAWSAKGDVLAFQREGADPSTGVCPTMRSQLGIYLVRPDGSSLRQLPAIPAGRNPSRQHPLTLDLGPWSPDNNHILYAIRSWESGDCFRQDLYLTSSTLYEIAANGGGATKVRTARSSFGDTAFSPSGDYLATAGLGDSCDLLIRASADGFRTLPTRSVHGCNDNTGLSFLWLPSGSRIVFSDGLHLGLIDISSGAVRSIVRRTDLPPDCRVPGNAAVCEEETAAVSPDGSEAAVVDYPTDPSEPLRLLLIGINDGTVTRLPFPAALSPPARPPSDVADVKIRVG